MSVDWYQDRVLAEVRQAAMRGVVRGAERVRGEIVRLITQTPKTGLIYRRRGVEHQASAPGEAPASDTGRLVNSTRIEYDVPQLSADVVVSTEYAHALEYGTQTIEPRPFARPALANKRAEIEDDVNAELAAVLQ